MKREYRGIAIIAIALVAALGIGLFLSRPAEPTPGKGLPSYTLSEVALHNTKDDCWMALWGNVYDFTTAVNPTHPGGIETILSGCGTEATALFEDTHLPQTEDPALHEPYLIGTLKDD